MSGLSSIEQLDLQLSSGIANNVTLGNCMDTATIPLVRTVQGTLNWFASKASLILWPTAGAR